MKMTTKSSRALLLFTGILLFLVHASLINVAAEVVETKKTEAGGGSDETQHNVAAPRSDDINSALGGIAKLVNDGRPTLPSNLNEILQALPDLLVSIPGVGPVDINKLPPWFVEYVLRGGQLPGVPQKTLDTIVTQYMQRMYAAAAQKLGRTAQDVPPLPEGVDPELYLRPVTELPASFISSVLQGYPLPHLTSEQTQVVKDYYIQGMPMLSALMKATNEADVKDLFSPKVLAMIKLMPPGFDFTRLPPEVIKSVMAGEVPDMSLLPTDVQEDLKKHLDHVFNELSASPAVPVNELLSKLPYFETPKLPAYSPYDINMVDRGLVVKQRGEAEGKDLDAEAIRFFTLTAIAIVSLLTLTCIGVALYRHRQAKRRMRREEGSTEDSLLTTSFDAGSDNKKGELASARLDARIDDDGTVV